MRTNAITHPPRPLTRSGAPHVRVPSALAFDESLARGARQLWVVLDDLAREHAGITAGAPLLCAALACSRASLTRWRRQLERAGWLAHTGARGRGAQSTWVPLGRVRKVTSLTIRPVDNAQNSAPREPLPAPVTPCDTGESGSRREQSDLAKRRAREPLSRGASSTARAREEEEAPRTTASARWSHTTPWCGQCDDPDYRWAQSPVHGWMRCPACHPAAEPAF